jgi:hypothetical protein
MTSGVDAPASSSPQSSARKVYQGFDDLPTEVHVPEGVRLDDDDPEPTTAMEDKEVRRAIAVGQPPPASARPASSGGGRRSRPKAGFLLDFRDESKTEVMNEQLQSELAKASQKPPPDPDSGPGVPGPVLPARAPRPRR